MKPTVRDANPTAAAAPRERRIDAYIVSANDMLLLELGPALGERFRTRPVERMDELPADAQAPWVGFIDGAREDARTWIQHIERTHPRAALIAIVGNSELGQWQGMVFRGSVCAALTVEQLNSAALADALARAQQRLQQTSPAAVEVPRQRPAGAGFGIGAARPPWLLPAILGGLAIVVVIGWLLAGHGRSTPAAGAVPSAATPTAPLATPADTTPAAAAPAMSVLEMLSSARSAFRDPDRQLPRTDGRPRGDSALELYAQALAQEPANAEARDGLRRLLTVGRSRMQSDLAAGRMEEAQRMLGIFRTSGVDPAAVKAMEGDVAAAMPRWLQGQVRHALSVNDTAAAEQAYAQLVALGADRGTLQDLRRAIDGRQSDSQLQGLADEVRTAIAAGALLEPAATSARARVQAMRQANRSHPATLAAQRDLQEALLAKAREAQAAAQLDTAQRWLTAAADLGASNEVTDLRRELQADADRLAARAAPATAASAPAPAAAPATSVAPATPAAPRFVNAKPLRSLNVTYPNEAAAARMQGYVVLEFTLGSDGHASDIQVIESTPATVFDKAARDAVAKGRYDTSVLGDGAGSRRARLRVTFKPG